MLAANTPVQITNCPGAANFNSLVGRVASYNESTESDRYDVRVFHPVSGEVVTMRECQVDELAEWEIELLAEDHLPEPEFPRLNTLINEPAPWEGVGVVEIHVFRNTYDPTTRSFTIANILFDEVTSERGETIFENTNGELFHVPNVAYYTVEAYTS